MREAGLLDDVVSCCDSCHDDWDDYGIEGCTVDVGDREFHVCHSVFLAIEHKKERRGV